nr:hypothetical protein [Tanacetum cinerariifolium]
VIEFGDSYEAPKDNAATGSASEGSAKKKGRTVAVTTKDMQKRRNDVQERTTLLLALPDEHHLRFTKNNSMNGEVNTASILTASTQVSPAWLLRPLLMSHKASCKTKLVNSVTKPLHTLHMDLFGPTSDETSGILRNFITEIENLEDLKAEAVNTTCYVQNMVLVNKSQNKTPYELFNGTKEAASQDVKKGVSSLRYISLPNCLLDFQDPEFPARVYKVEKAMYGLLQALKAWIFRYLKGHPKLGLWYPKESPFDLVTYSDSDYGGATQDRKSTTRGCQFLGRRLILWQCKKQTIVATSTTEAEYIAAASGCGQVLWIQNQLLDYGHHFIRDCFEKKLISVDHIHTDDNVADLLKKPFDVGRFQYLVVKQAMRGSVKGNHIIYTTFIVDFVEASHLRIETTDEGTKILATVDGKPRTSPESSIRRNLKLKDKAGISSLPDAELFENLTLMG